MHIIRFIEYFSILRTCFPRKSEHQLYPVAAPNIEGFSHCCVTLLRFLLGNLGETFKEKSCFISSRLSNLFYLPVADFCLKKFRMMCQISCCLLKERGPSY